MSVALLGAVPAVAVMYGIRHIAGGEPTAGTRGEQAGALMALRQLLQRLLAAVGSLVALSTLALGAAFALQQNLPAGFAPGRASAQLAPQTVLIFGGAGSALVAAAYAPASTALKTWAQRMCDELFPLQEADTAAVILNQAEDRSKLGQLLGADRSVVADLQTGLAILGPLPPARLLPSRPTDRHGACQAATDGKPADHPWPGQRSNSGPDQPEHDRRRNSTRLPGYRPVPPRSCRGTVTQI